MEDVQGAEIEADGVLFCGNREVLALNSLCSSILDVRRDDRAIHSLLPTGIFFHVPPFFTFMLPLAWISAVTLTQTSLAHSMAFHYFQLQPGLGHVSWGARTRAMDLFGMLESSWHCNHTPCQRENPSGSRCRWPASSEAACTPRPSEDSHDPAIWPAWVWKKCFIWRGSKNQKHAVC